MSGIKWNVCGGFSFAWRNIFYAMDNAQKGTYQYLQTFVCWGWETEA